MFIVHSLKMKQIQCTPLEVSHAVGCYFNMLMNLIDMCSAGKHILSFSLDVQYL